MVTDLELHQALQCLKDKLPDSKNLEKFQKWCQTNSPHWTKQLSAAIAKHHNIQHDWHLSSEQQQLLQCYYDANQLLSDCLNSNCEMTATVRQELKATLLLPYSNVE